MEKILTFKKVYLKLGTKYILYDINFNINKNDFVLLIGPNGSGKTTIIKTILGFYKITSGDIFYRDAIKDIKMVRSICGYVPQRFDIDKFFPIKVNDILNIIKSDKKLFESLIFLFKLKDIIEKPFGLLSGGERQKVLLTMALAKKPEILLLDEPNLNLDLNSYKDFLKYLEIIKNEFKITIIMATHFIHILPRLVNKVFVLKKGKMIYKSTPQNIFKRKNLLNLIYG